MRQVVCDDKGCKLEPPGQNIIGRGRVNTLFGGGGGLSANILSELLPISLPTRKSEKERKLAGGKRKLTGRERFLTGGGLSAVIESELLPITSPKRKSESKRKEVGGKRKLLGSESNLSGGGSISEPISKRKPLSGGRLTALSELSISSPQGGSIRKRKCVPKK